MHRIGTDLLWAMAAVFVAAVAWREVGILAGDLGISSVQRATEFAFGTGGHGKGTAA